MIQIINEFKKAYYLQPMVGEADIVFCLIDPTEQNNVKLNV